VNGPQHWEEADLILSGDPCEYGCPHGGCAHEMRMIARAQVHAVLALGAAEALARAEERIRELEDGLRDALNRIHALEDRQPDYADERHDHDNGLAGAGEGRHPAPEDTCPETSDGYHCTHWQEGVSRCCACGSEPDEDQADGRGPDEYDPGPEVNDEGGGHL
jgi:hypothetical protein